MKHSLRCLIKIIAEAQGGGLNHFSGDDGSGVELF
jgi:hypothetical protein